jgi:hypothetical protein
MRELKADATRRKVKMRISTRAWVRRYSLRPAQDCRRAQQRGARRRPRRALPVRPEGRARPRRGRLRRPRRLRGRRRAVVRGQAAAG